MTLKDEIDLIKRDERQELDRVRAKYRQLLKEARQDCSHDYTEWFMTPNPDFRYDINENIIWLRDCKLCGKTETRHGED